jgi:hypothetical protein
MKGKTKFGVLIWPLISLLVFAALIFVERAGIQYTVSDYNKDFIPDEILKADKPVQKIECLLLYDSLDKFNPYENITYVLSEMRIGYQLTDVSTEEIPAWNQYRTVVVAFSNLDRMQNEILSLLDWVEEGGRVLFAAIPEPNTTLRVICDDLGILYETFDYGQFSSVKMSSDLLLGGKDRMFSWEGVSRTTLNLQITDECAVHMVSGDDSQIPLLWERPYGNGKIIVNNSSFFTRKESRGILSASYSLLEDVFAYPVINASAFFIDDFPAPIPEGYNEIIYDQYQTDMDGFYTNIWFPDMMKLSSKYGLRYTGLIIETYEDSVVPPFEPQGAMRRFKYFGAFLLNEDFEIGLHGYNHMSLVLEDFDYKGFMDYTKWKNKENMAEATQEAIRFTKELFPEVELKTYVPPSNVLSEEGRAMLKEYFPQINTISGVLIDDIYGLEQEFGIGNDGIIDLPRIVAGQSLGDENQWIALSELGFHYMSSHFIHPDDSIDPERSLGKSWEELREDFDDYLQWLYGSAKGIRNMTAQEAAMAVQRYSNLTVDRSIDERKLALDIGGFYDEAWFLIRFNDVEPGFVDGGSLELVGGNLYLLHATKNHVEILLER